VRKHIADIKHRKIAMESRKIIARNIRMMNVTKRGKGDVGNILRRRVHAPRGSVLGGIPESEV
jgi:hypothetical protein